MPIQQEYLSARQANEQRYAQAMSIYDEIIKRYQPGGTFGKAALGQLEKEKTRAVGRETQQMISSGLYGTTTTAGLPTKWEAEVGAPSRLRLEDIMMERLSQAQVGKAGFIERREDVYPDVGAYAGYAGREAAAKPATTWGEYDPNYMQSLFGGLTGAPGIDGGARTTTAVPAATAPQAREPYTPIKPGEITMKPISGMFQPGAGTTGTPTIAEYLQQHGVDPASTDPGAIRRAQTLQKQYASLYR